MYRLLRPAAGVHDFGVLHAAAGHDLYHRSGGFGLGFQQEGQIPKVRGGPPTQTVLQDFQDPGFIQGSEALS